MSKMLSPEQLALLAQGTMYGSCEYLHKGGHLANWVENFIHGTKFGLKFYFPLHFIPLLFRYKQVLKKPWETIKTALKGCMRSTMVLATMVLIAKISICSYVSCFHKLDRFLMTYSSALVTLAAFIETPARISEMALYVMPRFFDAFWKFLKRRGLAKDMPYGQVVLFSVAMSAIMYSYKYEQDNIKPMYKTVCGKFFGEN